jgi:hypothetical protein
MARRPMLGLTAILVFLVFALPAYGAPLTIPVPDANPSNAESNLFEYEWPYPKKPFPERSSPVGPVTGSPGNNEGKPVSDPERKASLLVQAKELGSAAEVVRADAKGRFKLTAIVVSGPVTLAGKGEGFMLPLGKVAKWRIRIDFENVSPTYLSMDLGPNLNVTAMDSDVALMGVGNQYSETFVVAPPDPQTGLTNLSWTWQQNEGHESTGRSASYLILDVSTAGLESGSQPQLFCGNMEVLYDLLGESPGDQLGESMSASLDSIYIWVAEAYADVSMTATRIDWRVLKPGTYAVLATEIAVTGKGSISVQFKGFGNLAKVGGGSGHIPVFYAFGDNLPSNASEVWTSAPQLSDSFDWLRSIALDSKSPSTVRVWSKISVGEEIPSAEYANTGVITFIVSNNPIGNGDLSQAP